MVYLVGALQYFSLDSLPKLYGRGANFSNAHPHMANESQYADLPFLYFAPDGHRHLRLLHRAMARSYRDKVDGALGLLLYYHKPDMRSGHRAI